MTIGDLYAAYGEATIQAEMLTQRAQTLRAQILEFMQQQRLVEAQKLAEAEAVKAPVIPEETPKTPEE